MPRRSPLIPRGLVWINQIFGKAILSEPDGIVVRKKTAVERQASSPLLVSRCRAEGLCVTDFGTHYVIHHPATFPKIII